MVKKLYEEQDIYEIASAIRKKNGKDEKYKIKDMAFAIGEIETGVKPSGTKEITENGIYDVTEYESANVNVNVDMNSYFAPSASVSTTNYVTTFAKTMEKVMPTRIKSYKSYELAYAFYYYDKLKDISELSNWTLTNIYNLASAFDNCKSLKNLEALRNWDTSKVTNMSGIFRSLGTTNYTDDYKFDAIKNWDTSSVTNFSYAFNGLYSSNAVWKKHLVKDFELNWNIDKAGTMLSMFTGGSGSYVSFMEGKFSGLYTTNNVASGAMIISQMFNYQSGLKTIDLSKVNKTINNINSAFYNCTSLELLDIRGLVCSGITSSSNYSNALGSVPMSVKIIVKDSTEKSWWQVNFSAWSSCFYTVDEAIAEGIVSE